MTKQQFEKYYPLTARWTKDRHHTKDYNLFIKVILPLVNNKKLKSIEKKLSEIKYE